MQLLFEYQKRFMMTKSKKVAQIKALFLQKYKDAATELNYTNIYELLVAVMLSAQCTDKRVNIVTPAFFAKYPSTKQLANADIIDVKELIKSVSFYNNKAKNLIEMARAVESRFGGAVPRNQKDLVSLAGVGQKSANVVLGEYCAQNYMAVDTHVFRVSHRLGLSAAKSALQTESDLTRLFKSDLNLLHQAFVLFGRYECKAIKPLCETCFVKQYCIDSRNFKPS